MEQTDPQVNNTERHLLPVSNTCIKTVQGKVVMVSASSSHIQVKGLQIHTRLLKEKHPHFSV